MTHAEIDQILNNFHFTEFKWINAKDIVVAQWVRVKCTFGCSDFGLGTCPPNTPSVAECEKFFSEYDKAIIVRLEKQADKNNYPSDWSKEMTSKLLSAEREIFLGGYPKAFLLNQTCCSLCSNCRGDRLSCTNKRLSRPSPESFAVDVYATVKNVGMEINVISENPSEMNRIAILMIN